MGCSSWSPYKKNIETSNPKPITLEVHVKCMGPKPETALPGCAAWEPQSRKSASHSSKTKADYRRPRLGLLKNQEHQDVNLYLVPQATQPNG